MSALKIAKLQKWLFALKREEGGVAAVEFALVAPVFLFMMLGAFDIGHTVYMRAVLDGAVQKAARDSSLETGAASFAEIDANVTAVVQSLSANAVVLFNRQNYANFSNVDQAERLLTDSNGDGICNNNETYEDVNGNFQWDTDVGRQGIGGPQDIVQYTVTVTYPPIFPLGSFSRNGSANDNGTQKDVSFTFAGISPQRTLTSVAILRNQPFGQQIQRVPTIRSCP